MHLDDERTPAEGDAKGISTEEAPLSENVALSTLSRRTLLKIGWVAPVVLSVALMGFDDDNDDGGGNISPGTCSDDDDDDDDDDECDDDD